MGGERNGVERALIDSFLRFSSLAFLDFGCAPLEFLSALSYSTNVRNSAKMENLLAPVQRVKPQKSL